MAKWSIAMLILLMPLGASASPMVFSLSNYSGWPANGDYGLALAWPTSIMPAGTTNEFSISDVTLTWDPANLASGATLSGTLTNNGNVWNLDYHLDDVTPDGGGFTARNGEGWLTLDSNPSISQRLVEWWWAELNPLSFILVQTGASEWLAAGFMWLPKGQADKFSKGIFKAEATVVPLPAAVWLFGSALLAMFGLKRLGRRANAAA